MYALTTIDNPYSPFKDWKKWLSWDESHHHFCTRKLARLAYCSDANPDDENEAEIDSAILKIITEPGNTKYIRVTETSRIIPMPLV